MVFLHGTLVVKIDAARGVPTEPLVEVGRSFKKTACIKACYSCERTLGAHNHSDAYCAVHIGHSVRAHTSVIASSEPVWEEAFRIPVADRADDVIVWLKDADAVGADRIGSVSFSVLDIMCQRPINGWYRMQDIDGNPRQHTEIKLSITFTPVSPALGVRGEMSGVPDVYFPLRKGCRLRLYNDAHQEAGQVVPLADGRSYESRSLWTDVYNDVMQARHFIYIAGWSVKEDVQLLRDKNKPQSENKCPNLGELLIQKADAGVRVLVLPWDDRTGIMGTFDEEVNKFFRGTKVVCRKLVRSVAPAAGFATVTSKVKTSAFFTHHQKVIVMDTPDAAGQDRVVAYVGGVDLTMGRYDTRDHLLFGTLATTHSDDFYNLAFPTASSKNGGPRQAWHDTHSRLEGPPAYDVLHNFEQRWRTLPPGEEAHLLALEADNVYRPRHLSPCHPPSEDSAVVATPTEDPDSWHVQVFRSIDEDSVRGFLSSDDKRVSGKDAVALGLAIDKGKVVDHSIQDAYIRAIRRAQHFIYIENQYFIGSSQMWDHNKHAGSINLIPVELALKIVSKINAGEPFAVYVVMPLFCEGDPQGAATKEVLRFQYNTMCMMYKMIAEALVLHGRADDHPRNYLAFFCLGNREPKMQPGEKAPTKPPKPGTFHARGQASRRGMVYVHSKAMVVDDEYIIVGSANINQRSMDGSRDTEIAMGAFQPAYLAGELSAGLPSGDVHGFRLSLWAEHAGGVQPAFSRPSSLECMKELQRIGAANWDAFAAKELTAMPSHLMNYPLHVAASGRVGPLEDHPFIPDTEVPVMGLAAFTLPDDLTT